MVWVLLGIRRHCLYEDIWSLYPCFRLRIVSEDLSRMCFTQQTWVKSSRNVRIYFVLCLEVMNRPAMSEWTSSPFSLVFGAKSLNGFLWCLARIQEMHSAELTTDLMYGIFESLVDDAWMSRRCQWFFGIHEAGTDDGDDEADKFFLPGHLLIGAELPAGGSDWFSSKFSLLGKESGVSLEWATCACHERLWCKPAFVYIEDVVYRVSKELKTRRLGCEQEITIIVIIKEVKPETGVNEFHKRENRHCTFYV